MSNTQTPEKKFDTGAILNQASAFTRGGIYFAAGWTVGYGMLNGESALTIAGSLAVLATSAWTGLANSNSSVVKAAAAIPDVKRMDIADPKLARAAQQADPSTVVVVAEGGSK